MAHPFFTIGHSTRPVAEFIEMLTPAHVKMIADVRTIPRSRTNPQYNSEIFSNSLEHAGIGYEHLAELGGLRGKRPDVPREVNAFWKNDSFHNYADYALSEPFARGLARLRALGAERRCAIMCAEAVWWRCHRRIIADYLIAAGEAVFHILSGDRTEPARLTPGIVRRTDGTLLYPKRDDGGENREEG
jgi:uncharacterized protein (DUF488 family)